MKKTQCKRVDVCDPQIIFSDTDGVKNGCLSILMWQHGCVQDNGFESGLFPGHHDLHAQAGPSMCSTCIAIAIVISSSEPVETLEDSL